jgi:uncharacterized protein YbjT (DUF2867 family)
MRTDNAMRVLVAGSHGKIGQRLVRLLTEQGHQPVAMIRDVDQAAELRHLGGEPLVADLEGDLGAVTEGCHAVVYTAGAGAGSGAAKKETVDRQGAEKLIASAVRHGVRRFVIVSSMGADAPEEGPEQMRPYYAAKRAADDALATSGLDHTIVRPGQLTDEPGDGGVSVALSLGRSGQVSRDDVAAVLVACLTDDRTVGKTFELLDGDTPIVEALRSL